VKKANYHEKVDHEMAPYAAIDAISTCILFDFEGRRGGWEKYETDKNFLSRWTNVGPAHCMEGHACTEPNYTALTGFLAEI
jgi:hypothetical protein